MQSPSSENEMDTLFKTEATFPLECPEESLESDLASESDSCSERDPSSDSTLGKSNDFELLEKTHLSDKDRPWLSKSLNPTDSSQSINKTPIRDLLCDITLGDIVKEIYPHFQPVLASTIKEVLSENTSSHCPVCMSSINGSGVNPISSTTGENFLVFRNPHTSPFVQLSYGFDEELEMKKILDNPWNSDVEDKSIKDQNSKLVVPCTNSQVQHSTQNDNKSQKLRKLIRVCVVSMLVIIILVIVGVVIFVKLELDFYGRRTTRTYGGTNWLRQRKQFFLSPNFV